MIPLFLLCLSSYGSTLEIRFSVIVLLEASTGVWCAVVDKMTTNMATAKLAMSNTCFLRPDQLTRGLVVVDFISMGVGCCEWMGEWMDGGMEQDLSKIKFAMGIPRDLKNNWCKIPRPTQQGMRIFVLFAISTCTLKGRCFVATFLFLLSCFDWFGGRLWLFKQVVYETCDCLHIVVVGHTRTNIYVCGQSCGPTPTDSTSTILQIVQ